MSSSPSWRRSWLGGRPHTAGSEDPHWTLAGFRVLIARTFRLDCSSAAVWRLLHRHGWPWQCPARRAVGRDERAVGLWKKDVWPRAE
ncbi:winged helix-turn-helix domain-containing protein [Streptomyces sp. IMTB 2501]|uniref:helix-turn-helix domain-containing protein n=1 Tax=Streptomyces sp. IMTB 2501 TaxID=1776340 RepID=UPI00211678C4|nr:winged helix-turn-helix domain-containing protein [Streptomyces sp. IMTB 2501]